MKPCPGFGVLMAPLPARLTAPDERPRLQLGLGSPQGSSRGAAGRRGDPVRPCRPGPCSLLPGRAWQRLHLRRRGAPEAGPRGSLGLPAGPWGDLAAAAAGICAKCKERLGESCS